MDIWSGFLMMLLKYLFDLSDLLIENLSIFPSLGDFPALIFLLNLSGLLLIRSPIIKDMHEKRRIYLNSAILIKIMTISLSNLEYYEPMGMLEVFGLNLNRFEMVMFGLVAFIICYFSRIIDWFFYKFGFVYLTIFYFGPFLINLNQEKDQIEKIDQIQQLFLIFIGINFLSYLLSFIELKDYLLNSKSNLRNTVNKITFSVVSFLKTIKEHQAKNLEYLAIILVIIFVSLYWASEKGSAFKLIGPVLCFLAFLLNPFKSEKDKKQYKIASKEKFFISSCFSIFIAICNHKIWFVYNLPLTLFLLISYKILEKYGNTSLLVLFSSNLTLLQFII